MKNTADRATIKDLNLRIIAANEALVRASGRKSLDEIVGKTDAEVFGTSPHVLAYMADERKAQSLKAGEYIEKEEQFVFPDGRVKATSVKKFPVFDDSGKLIATANISRDISPLKVAEMKFKQSTLQLEAVIDSVDEGITLSDYTGYFAIYNSKMEELTGYSQQEANQAKDFIEALYPDITQREKAYQEIGELIHGGKSNYTETIIRTKQGQLKNILVYTRLLKYHKKEYFLSVYQDITERKKAARILKESEQELRELNATKDKFFSIIAHDLKNPFGTITTFLDLLNTELDSYEPEELKDIIQTIYETAERGYELLENLLEWSRAKTGRLTFKPERIELNAIIGDCIALLKSTANAKFIKLLAQVARNTYAFADPNMVLTVVRNLLTNALKFTDKGGEVRISVVMGKSKQQMIRVVVEDTGIGIRQEDLSKLFRIDVHHTTRGTQNEEGTGLGLILCQEFVEKNGGTIWVESTYGEGSRFIFTLPTDSSCQT